MIQGALRRIDPNASLTDPARSIPWTPLTQLFDAFADIPGVGYSKTTKALHPKRPELIPMLDSYVQAYLAGDEPPEGSFGEQAAGLVRSYKEELDRNRSALRELRRELASRAYDVTEVRILDLLIWSVSAAP